MRMPDEWWWWAPTIERDTVENAFRKGPQYTPKQENQLVQVAPPKYEDIEKEPPSYTSLLIEKVRLEVRSNDNPFLFQE